MSLEADSMSMALVGFQNNRIPEMLGTFKLDDHNIEEWDDDTTNPGIKRRGRKEIGKWVDPDRNADIQFQRVDDSEKSGRGADRQRTEIIEGKAPDSSFRIVRSQCQFNNNNSDSGTNETGSRQSSVMTSYQMSSSNGVRTTSKTTSNKSSSKTITVSSSGGGRSLQSQPDDFENLKIAFQPLDSSTQREKLNMIRNSGTMGFKRRPPTRKHTSALRTSATTDSSNTFHNSVDEIYEDDANKNFSELTSASLPLPKSNGDLSIVSYKNISPKLRVGFPVEIQVELRTKLRGGGSSSMVSGLNETTMNGDSNQESPLLSGDLYSTITPNHSANPTNGKILNFTMENDASDQKDQINSSERRKSYAFESINQKQNIKDYEWKSKLIKPNSGSSANIYDRLLEKNIGDEREPYFSPRKEEISYSLVDNQDNFMYDSLDSVIKSLESSPSPERSRKVIKLTKETEQYNGLDYNKSAKLILEGPSEKSNNSKSFFTNDLYEPSENFPNYRRNSVMGILSSGNNEFYTRYSKPLLANEHSTLLDFNSFSQNNANKVSHTWISSVDGQKPSQTARDEYVTTSISATNDQFIKPQKKVEFCVTEVHFIPESGKFNIVKSDENKPSTVHLFRKKKRQRNSIINLETVNISSNESQENLNNDDSGYVEDEQLDLYARTSNPYTFAFSNSNDNLSDDPTSKDIENVILPNSCEELQIQRFLKQLKPSSSNSSTTTESESSTESIDTLLKSTEIREKFDGNTGYENGSFVPYVIRQSLIDMNNRNGVKSLDPSDPNHISDNSSTTSTYSLPKSDHSREHYYNPFKLTGLDTTVENKSSSPKITSVELIYSNLENDENDTNLNWRSSVDTNRSKSENFLYRSSPERIPTPVMPSGLRTMPPYRNDISTVSNPSLYDDGYSFDRNSSKPPTPILPIQFSTFEKTGAALRERFYAKNPKCLECTIMADDTTVVNENSQANPVDEVNRSSNYLSSEGNFQERLKRISKNNFQTPRDEQETEIAPSIKNNIDESSISRSTVVRSLTFPKSNRPEPEWVIKAKLKAISREARVEDWSLLGSKAGTSSTPKNEEPPWISELNYRKIRKSHQTSNSKSDDDQTQKNQNHQDMPSHVYPWNRTTQSKDLYSRPQNPVTGNNKSVVDLNRDSDSILIEPIQIEVKSEKITHSKPNLENCKQNGEVSIKSHELKRENNQIHSKSKKQHENIGRIPLQTLTQENKTSTKSKPKTPPKSPDRNIASRKVQTTTFSASMDRKIQPAAPASSPIDGHRKEREHPSSQSRSTRPEKPTPPVIHRHPTVKITKLPVKNLNSNRKPVTSPEGKNLEKAKGKPSQNDSKRSSRDKDKQHSSHIIQGGESKAFGKIRMVQGSSTKMSHKN